MKTRNQTKKVGSFATAKLQAQMLCILAAIIGIALIGCGGTDTPTEPPETFTVTFYPNGGTQADGTQPPPQTIAKGGTVAEPTITKANHTLDGWYTESVFTNKWNFADTVTADIALYAKWTALCACNPKEHYLPCTCGGTDCICTIKPRGSITDSLGNAIPIWQSADVVDGGKAATATENIIAGYNALPAGYKGNLAGKIQEIWIVSGGNGFEKDNATGKVILNFNQDTTKNGAQGHIADTYDDYPELFAQLHQQGRNTLRLAKAPVEGAECLTPLLRSVVDKTATPDIA